MKKVLLFIWLCITGLLSVVISVLYVDWWLGGGYAGILNHNYEPAYLSQVWEIVSHIYTWTPEGTLFRGIFFLVAFVIMFGLPIVLAVYLYKQTLKIYKKYREL